MLKHLGALIFSKIGLWPSTTNQNRQIKCYKITKNCHVTLWSTPTPPYVIFGDTLANPPSPLKCHVFFEWAPYLCDVFRAKHNKRNIKIKITDWLRSFNFASEGDAISRFYDFIFRRLLKNDVSNFTNCRCWHKVHGRNLKMLIVFDQFVLKCLPC